MCDCQVIALIKQTQGCSFEHIDYMNKSERQRKIIQLIEQSNGRQMLSTNELASLFGVSEMTVRRDLQELSLDGLVRRQHGGATPPRPVLDPQRKEIGIVLESK